MEKKLAMLQSANQQPAASGRAAKRARTVPAPADGPENGAAALGNANSMRPPPSVPAAHGASVRGTKRRLSPDDAPPLACVSADNAAVGPEPRRARTSQPVASQVADASESKQPVPYDGRGMRSIGLPGHLKRVEVVDFMCHEHMVMDFSPHVTFVSGTNGSGKSATLQALQCCLGVKASKTGRAGSFKTFVRSGANQAIVRVTLWNKPYHLHDAFQHEVYGDEITVERKISLNGVSAWALKDARGRVVAHRRDDLDSLLSTLGLNASNPVTVMTQDTSRSFLAGTSNRADQEKFQLYMEATQLGAIAENLAISKGQLAAMDAQIATVRCLILFYMRCIKFLHAQGFLWPCCLGRVPELC